MPAAATFVVDEDGYRIYTPTGSPEALVRFDVQRDLWSRFQDYAAIFSWTNLPFIRTGGGFRGYDELGNPLYQTNDYTLKTSKGWRIVLANYPHEVVFRGNLLSDDQGASLFDTARLTAQGIVPRLSGFDSLQTYTVAGEGGGGSFTTGDRARLFAIPTNPLLASSYLAPDNAGVAAIRTKTDQLNFTDGNVDANVGGLTIEGGFTESDRARLLEIPTNPALADDTRLNNLDAAISSRATAVDLSVTVDGGFDTNDRARLNAIPLNPLLATDYTPADNDGIASIRAIVEQLVIVDGKVSAVIDEIEFEGGFTADDRVLLATVVAQLGLLYKRQGLVDGISASELDATVGVPGYVRTSDNAVNQILTKNFDGSITIQNA